MQREIEYKIEADIDRVNTEKLIQLVGNLE